MVTLHTTPVLSLPQIRERFDIVWCGGMPSDDTTTRGELLPREGREERNQIVGPADREAMESRTRGIVRTACGRHRLRPKPLPFVPSPDDPVVCRCGCGMAIPPRPRRKDGSLTAHGRSIRGYVRGHNAATSVVRGRAYVAPAAGQTTESEGGC